MALTNNQTALRLEIYGEISETAGALASPARLMVLQLLLQAPHTVEKLAMQTGFSLANVSQHLQKLSKAKLVVCRKQGTHRLYSVERPEVGLFLERLLELTDALVPEQRERENKLTEQNDLGAPWSLQEVMSQLKNDQATLVDVRTLEEFQYSPVESSRHLDSSLLSSLTALAPKSKPVYVMCRGPYCTAATDTVQALRAKGYKAYRLRESPQQLRRLRKAPKKRP